MKVFAVLVAFFLQFSAQAQSPSLTVYVEMDPVTTEAIRYKIEMKICEPVNMTERGDWFTRDTSAIDFASLKASDITCGDYFDKGTPELIMGEKDEEKPNTFKFSNHLFAWEKIIIVKFTNISSRGIHQPMYIVMPVKYKCFISSINLTAISFRAGKVIFLNDTHPVYKNNRLVINQSLKKIEGSEVEDSSLRELLESDK